MINFQLIKIWKKIDASRTVEQIQTYYEAQYGDEAEEKIKTVLASSGYSTLDEYEKAMSSSLSKNLIFYLTM